jgi:ABC-type polysaccharide/polyol phosphate transport system ATPase subunit
VSDDAVRAERISKRFSVSHQRQTTLLMVRAILGGRPLRQEHWVLRDISFAVPRGEKLAIVGRNGSGKTTLLRVLTGIYEPTSGHLAVTGAPRALFDCSIGFMRELPLVDNIYLFGAIHGIDRDRLAPREGAIFELAELEHLKFARLKELSTGQIQRLALSTFSQTDSDLLIFDEVLANVDRGFAHASAAFFRSLAASDKTVILTSHDASFLRAHCQKALWLEKGRVKAIGPCADVLDAYERSFDVDAEPAPRGQTVA